MGSIEQPDSIEKGVEFWDDKEKVVTHEGGGDVGMMESTLVASTAWHVYHCVWPPTSTDTTSENELSRAGVHQVFKHYTRLSSQKRTIALRDFYPGG